VIKGVVGGDFREPLGGVLPVISTRLAYAQCKLYSSLFIILLDQVLRMA